MARLPDFSALGDRPAPRPQTPVQGYRAGQVEGVAIQAGEALARSGERLGQVAAGIAESEDRLNYARARSAFLRAKTELDSAFESDQDYATWEKRYGAALSKVRDTIAGGLTGARYRTEFEAETGLDYERGLAVIREKTRARVRDAGRADLLTTLSQNREAALNSPDAVTREALIGATNDAITSAVESGMLTAVEGVEQREAWAKTYQADREARFAQTFTTGLDRWRNAVLSDPGKIGTAEAELAAQIAASGLPEADKLKYTLQLKNGLGQSAVQAAIIGNPDSALAALESGAWDAYLDADKKATLMGSAESEGRARLDLQLRLADRADREAEKLLNEARDTSAAVIFDGILEGNIDDAELDRALADRRITGDQYRTLRTALKSELTATDQPAVLLEMDRDLTQGALTRDQVWEAFAAGQITRERKDSYLADIDSGTDQVTKAALDFVQANVGGIRGPLAVLDTEASAREANAIREFRDRVREGGDAADPWAIADDVVKRYRVTPPTADALPRPRYLDGAPTDVKALDQARTNTALAMQRGEITPQQAAAEARIIQQLIEMARTAEAAPAR